LPPPMRGEVGRRFYEACTQLHAGTRDGCWSKLLVHAHRGWSPARPRSPTAATNAIPSKLT
jgi:hypothetical protein